MKECELCKYYDWAQAEKIYEHACFIGKTNTCGNCSFYESTIDEHGCTHIGVYGISPEGICCGECDPTFPACERFKQNVNKILF